MKHWMLCLQLMNSTNFGDTQIVTIILEDFAIWECVDSPQKHVMYALVWFRCLQFGLVSSCAEIVELEKFISPLFRCEQFALRNAQIDNALFNIFCDDRVADNKKDLKRYCSSVTRKFQETINTTEYTFFGAIFWNFLSFMVNTYLTVAKFDCYLYYNNIELI